MPILKAVGDQTYVMTYKADIWRRATDTEAETVIAILAQQSTRLQRLFEDAQYLDPTDADYPTLRAGFVQAFGDARSAELLAPSE